MYFYRMYHVLSRSGWPSVVLALKWRINSVFLYHIVCSAFLVYTVPEQRKSTCMLDKIYDVNLALTDQNAKALCWT